MPEVNDIGMDWRAIGGVATAWFDASSLTEGATLAGRVVELHSDAVVDMRASGVRVRLDSPEQCAAVSSVAAELGLAANPSVLQRLDVVIESADPATLRPFWQRALDYVPDSDGDLIDASRRDPTIRFRRSTDERPLRNRIHLDVVRPASAVDEASIGEASGPYGVRHADADGNEVDLVPGSALDDTDDPSDWQAVFSAMACYRVSSPTQQRDVATTVAAIGDDAGFPLLIDLRAGLVIVDSGKDLWEADAHGLALDFTGVAAQLQTAAHELGATAEPTSARFVQLFYDAADVAAVRAFWSAALGYTHDRRAGVTDIVDPRRLDPVIVFQELDVSDTERRQQRNRIHVELTVPSDLVANRLATATSAGGRIIDESDDRWCVADPEDNELVLVSAT